MSINPDLIDWYEWEDDMGDAGLPGTGVTSGQLLDITSRLTAAEADIDAAEAELATVPGFDLTGITSGQLLQWNGSQLVPYTNTKTVTITLPFKFDGGGSPVPVGAKLGYLVDFAGTITGATMLADVASTTTSVGVWIDTYTNFPPVLADEKFVMGITLAQKYKSTSLNVPFVADSFLTFNCGANNNATQLAISLRVTRTI